MKPIALRARSLVQTDLFDAAQAIAAIQDPLERARKGDKQAQCARAVTWSVSPAWRCRWLITAKRLRACGLPVGPNMRIRLFGDAPVSAPSCSKPTVALM